MADIVTVTIDNKAVTDALRLMGEKARNPAPVLKAIGERLVRSTEERFDKEEDPEGNRWRLLTYSRPGRYRSRDRYRPTHGTRGEQLKGFREYLERKKILTDTGALRDSIYPEVEGSILCVGSPMKYAAVHQLGSAPEHRARIPARPYLGMSRDDEVEVLAIIGDYLTP